MRTQLSDHCFRPFGLSNTTPCRPGLAGERAFVVAERPAGLHRPSLRTHYLWIGVPTPSNALSSCSPCVKTNCQPWIDFGPGGCGAALCIYLLGLACAPSCSSFFFNEFQPRGAARQCLKVGRWCSTQEKRCGASEKHSKRAFCLPCH